MTEPAAASSAHASHADPSALTGGTVAGASIPPDAPAAFPQPCDACGGPLVRRANERPHRFAARKYCSQRCARADAKRCLTRAGRPPRVIIPASAFSGGANDAAVAARYGVDLKCAWRARRRHGIAPLPQGRQKAGAIKSPARRQALAAMRARNSAHFAARAKPAQSGSDADIDAAIAAYLAAGGEITHCPPAWCAAGDITIRPRARI